MTPKEKAEELIKKFSAVGLQQRGECIVCALIAVELLIKELEECSIYSMYWIEVKKQIEKL